MYEPHEFFKAPAEGEALWRYMDFTKFVSMLASKSLYFTRPDKYSDVFEGCYPKKNIKASEQGLRELLSNKNFCADLDVERLVRDLKPNSNHGKITTGINCWHKNKYESAAMWNLYLKTNEGISVKSTFSRLSSSFHQATDRIHIGEVNYIDYDEHHIDAGNIFSPFLHKRISFEHEKEVRAIVWRPQAMTFENGVIGSTISHGVSIDCDLSLLIEEVYVAPTSQPWFRELVSSILLKYEVNVPVRQSSLDEAPY